MSLSVIIAAAGQGKRFYSESLEIPKPLFYFKNKPIIAHLIDVYKELSNNIIVVVAANPLGNLLEGWLLDYYKNPNWLKIIEQPEALGTNDAVNRASKFVEEECLISWSDFILNKEEFINIIKNNNKNSLFFTSDIDCRFGEKNNRVVKEKSNPGFIGLYYFNKLSNLDLLKEDLIENFENEIVNTKFINSINLGTVADLVKNSAFEKKSNRYFNQIKFTQDKVYKTANNEYSIDLQKKEANWYKNCSSNLKKYIPDCEFDEKNNTLILEKIDGRPLSECKLNSNFWRKQLPELLIELHQPANIPVNEKSCQLVYIDKPQKRLKEVENTINAWFNKNKIINGYDYENWNFPEPPKDLIPKKFTAIHGDLQFSNSMLDKNNNIKILDPRGYFGETLLYGDPAYDIAKILYAVDAYHKINEGKFSIHKSDDKTFLIHNSDIKIDSDVKWFFDWACDRYEISKEKLNYLLFSIWLSLTSYISDNPLAIVASYCKAMIRSREFVI